MQLEIKKFTTLFIQLSNFNNNNYYKIRLIKSKLDLKLRIILEKKIKGIFQKNEFINRLNPILKNFISMKITKQGGNELLNV